MLGWVGGRRVESFLAFRLSQGFGSTVSIRPLILNAFNAFVTETFATLLESFAVLMHARNGRTVARTGPIRNPLRLLIMLTCRTWRKACDVVPKVGWSVASMHHAVHMLVKSLFQRHLRDAIMI
jgi:hypothetical protein